MSKTLPENYCEFTFDLSEDLLKKYYPNLNIKQSWGDVGTFLKSRGFTAIGDSDYISIEPIPVAKVLKIIEDLRKDKPWFEFCTKKIYLSILDDFSNIKEKWESQRTDKETKEFQKALSANSKAHKRAEKPKKKFKKWLEKHPKIKIQIILPRIIKVAAQIKLAIQTRIYKILIQTQCYQK